jgi:hypothetical protein
VIPRDLLTVLKLDTDSSNADALAVVISHDCDLVKPESVEPDVEIAIGQAVVSPQPGLTHGQSPQTLHIDFLRNGEEVFIELSAQKKAKIRKADLVDIELTCTPESA